MPHGMNDLGRHFGDELYSREVDYLVDQEWALTADDVLWRRSKLGLHLAPATVAALGRPLAETLSAAGAGRRPMTLALAKPSTCGSTRHLHLEDLSSSRLPAGRGQRCCWARPRAGKTSLMRMMAGLDRPTAGRV